MVSPVSSYFAYSIGAFYFCNKPDSLALNQQRLDISPLPLGFRLQQIQGVAGTSIYRLIEV